LQGSRRQLVPSGEFKGEVLALKPTEILLGWIKAQD
jgi:hypothetical protein